jgi:arylsulfatase A-like enzyme
MVSEMDKGVGEIVTALSEASILDNTIVIFCSDNGATTLGSNGALRGFKATNFEGGHRVPCVVQWPGHIDAGNESTQLMVSMDLFPTLSGMAGVELPKRLKLDGIDLSEITLGEREPIERTMVWNGTTIRRGRWKYMASQKGLAVDSLFDLSAEVDESTNLIAQYPDIAQSFRSELELWKNDIEKTKTPQPTPPK